MRLLYRYPGERHHFAVCMLNIYYQPPKLVANCMCMYNMVMGGKNSNTEKEVRRDGKQM